MSVVLQVVSSMDNLGNFSLDRNVTAIRSEPGNVPATIPTYNIRHANTYSVFCQTESTHMFGAGG